MNGGPNGGTRVEQIEVRRSGERPEHQEMVEQVGEDQPDRDDEQQLPHARRAKEERDRQQHEAHVPVVDAQAVGEAADGAGVARDLQVHAEAQGGRDRFHDDGAEQTQEQHAARAQPADECEEIARHGWGNCFNFAACGLAARHGTASC